MESTFSWVGQNEAEMVRRQCRYRNPVLSEGWWGYEILILLVRGKMERQR